MDNVAQRLLVECHTFIAIHFELHVLLTSRCVNRATNVIPHGTTTVIPHGTRRSLRAMRVCIFALHFGRGSVDDNYSFVSAVCVEVLSAAVHPHVGRRHLPAADRAVSSGLDGARWDRGRICKRARTRLCSRLRVGGLTDSRGRCTGRSIGKTVNPRYRLWLRCGRQGVRGRQLREGLGDPWARPRRWILSRIQRWSLVAR